MHVRTDRTLIRAAAESVRYVVIDLVAPRAVAKTERAAVNIALVLDRSGSMGEGKMELAKAAAVAAIRMLRETDRFAVVAYDDRLEVVVESTPATPEAVRNALARIATISARGNTDLCGGWLQGCGQIAAHLTAGSIGRCLLLTDGQANAGTTEPDEIARHAAELRRRGVSTSTFGVGHDFNGPLLQRMADEGGGHFYYVETAAQILDLLTSELGETLEVTARNARVEFDATGLARVEPLTGFRSERVGNKVIVHFGDLASAQEVQAVLAVTFPKGAPAASVRLAFTADSDGADLAPSPVTLEWTYAGHHANDQQPRARDVDRIVAEVYAARARREAVQLNRDGDYERAQKVLSATAKRIRQYAGDDDVLNTIATRLVEELQVYSSPMSAGVAMRAYAVGERALRSRDSTGRSRRRE